MSQLSKSLKIILSVLMLGALLSACKNPLSPNREVTYHVTGTGRADVTYASSDGSTSQSNNVTLPWNSFMSGAKKGEFAYISAQKDSSSACVTVEIKVDGKTFESSLSCGPFSIATASGTLK